nr:CTB family bacteriocin [Scytonema hyalinum WJT4-NPBG1]
MSDALFTELSIEQQEVVAGGYYGLPGISDIVKTDYSLNA